MMKNLPEVMYYDIISYLEYYDQIVFARTNNILAKIILKQVRIILKLKKIERVELETIWRKSPDGYESPLPVEYINNSLKELSIAGYNFTNLPVITNLERLSIRHTSTLLRGFQIADYSNLRILKFHGCPNIEDVRSLGRIHELHLSDCHGIRDISCLNHNYKIIIEECSKIVDYSRSFRYSKIVRIDFRSYNSAAEKCNLSQLLEVRELSIRGNPPGLVLPQCASLGRISLLDYYRSFNIPSEGKIQEVSITNCCDFSSLSNFGRIYHVKLHSLNISTLEGLGRGNHVVEIENCPRIRDFRVLRYCSKVSIRDCEGFQDFSHLKGVKRFIFSTENLNLSTDMEGVSCLKLQDVPSDLLSLKLPKSLKRLVFEFGSVYLIKHLFPTFFPTLPSHVRKIIVFGTVTAIEVFRSMLKKEELSFPDFIIEIINTQIHFVRKLH